MSADENLSNVASYPCPECIVGVMRPRTITYFTWLGQELITVPNFPAWVCDLCGKREYDNQAIAWLKMLLNPNTGKPTPHKHSANLRANSRLNPHPPLTPDS